MYCSSVTPQKVATPFMIFIVTSLKGKNKNEPLHIIWQDCNMALPVLHVFEQRELATSEDAASVTSIATQRELARHELV